MTADRLQVLVPGTDPAPARRSCGCRGEASRPRKGASWRKLALARSRGRHQDGCALAEGVGTYLVDVLGLRLGEEHLYAVAIELRAIWSGEPRQLDDEETMREMLGAP